MFLCISRRVIKRGHLKIKYWMFFLVSKKPIPNEKIGATCLRKIFKIIDLN